MIKSLTSLRGLFAIAIVLFHRQWHPADEMAYCGVVFFFVLSGFLLTLRHNFTTVDRRSWWQFVVQRARRVYPLHLAVWAAFIAIIVTFALPCNALAAVLNALLLHAWVPLREFYLSVNKPIWFLSALMFCYVCFPLLRALQHRVRLLWQVLCMMVILVFLSWVYTLLSPTMLNYTHFFPPLRLLDFTLGMVLAQVWRRLPAEVSTGIAQRTVIELSAVLTLVILACVAHFTAMLDTWRDTLLWWLPVSMLIVVCAAHHGHEGWVCRALSWRPLVWLGTISLEVYVLQDIVPLAYSHFFAPVLGHFGIEAYGLSVIVHLVVLVCIAALVHYRPFKLRKSVSPKS